MSQDRRKPASAPFEKIVTARVQKSLLQKLAKGNGEVVCKASGDSLFRFVPDQFDGNDTWAGNLEEIQGPIPLADQVIMHFSSGPDRYYSLGFFQKLPQRGTLRLLRSIYRLERRQHFRIPIMEGISSYCNIIKWGDETVFIPTHLLDLSQGGLRAEVAPEHTRPTKMGTPVRVVLNILQKWKIEVNAEVRYSETSQGRLRLGIQFRPANPQEQRHLMILTMELQRVYVQRKDAV